MIILKSKYQFMNKKNILTPVKKILKIIHSCENQEEIQHCKNLTNNYIKSAKKNQVVNLEDLENRLNEQIFERQETLYLVKIFNKNI